MAVTVIFTACDIQPNTGNGGQNSDLNQECIHSFSSWEIEQQATCKDEGILSRICLKCGEKEVSKIAVSNLHNEVIDSAVAPTCTETGLTEGEHCTKCGEVFIAQGHIKALGHNDGEWVIEKEPTETEDGYKYKECGRCGEKNI